MNKPPLTSPKIKKKTCDSIKTYPVTQIRFYLGMFRGMFNYKDYYTG